MQFTREHLIDMVKKIGNEIVENAETYIDDDFVNLGKDLTVSFTINSEVGEITQLEITKTGFPKKVMTAIKEGEYFY